LLISLLKAITFRLYAKTAQAMTAITATSKEKAAAMTRTSPAADGYAEREAANNAQPQITLDAGKGCAISVQRRKLIEQGFGWSRPWGACVK
jgi:uncharacterized protein YccT (UPF0319 family)